MAVDFLYISHNLKWYAAIVHKFTKIYSNCSKVWTDKTICVSLCKKLRNRSQKEQLVLRSCWLQNKWSWVDNKSDILRKKCENRETAEEKLISCNLMESRKPIKFGNESRVEHHGRNFTKKSKVIFTSFGLNPKSSVLNFISDFKKFKKKIENWRSQILH